MGLEIPPERVASARDTTVKIAPRLRFPASVVLSPNSGNTRICVATAMM
jgi:hypothetical protein